MAIGRADCASSFELKYEINIEYNQMYEKTYPQMSRPYVDRIFSSQQIDYPANNSTPKMHVLSDLRGMSSPTGTYSCILDAVRACNRFHEKLNAQSCVAGVLNGSSILSAGFADNSMPFYKKEGYATGLYLATTCPQTYSS